MSTCCLCKYCNFFHTGDINLLIHTMTCSDSSPEHGSPHSGDIFKFQCNGLATRIKFDGRWFPATCMTVEFAAALPVAASALTLSRKPRSASNLSGLGRLSLMSSISASIRVERASLLSGCVDSGPDYRHLSQSYWAFRKLLNRSRQSFSTSSSVVCDPASFRTASSIPSSRYPLSCIGRPPANVRRDGVLTGWPS